MSYLALYRKYRPSSFDDMVGQNDVVNVLKKEVLQNRISHAYLFSGPRGTGKTSTAKIIARMVNCENLSDDGLACGECDSCKNFNASSDIVEIDAASNNGVDEIRELRDKVNLVPSSCRYKVYIIDEVHMLTNQAFNALLKTLEEPPSHVIFILATTEFYKIPMTVVSRCQKFQFSKISNDEMVLRLRKIADTENISVSNDCLFEIARLSDGGMRDSINMLDQLASFSDNNIKVDDVYKLSGTFSFDEMYDLIINLFSNNYKYLIDFTDSLSKNGKNINKFLEEFISYVRDIIYFNLTGNYLVRRDENINKIAGEYSIDIFYKLLGFLNNLLTDIKQSSVPYILLSVSLINISRVFDKNIESVVDNIKIDNNNEKIIVNKDNNSINNTEVVVKKKENVIDLDIYDDEFKNLRIENTFSSATKEKLNDLKNKWNDIDKLLFDNKYAAIAGLLKDVEIIVVGDANIIFLAKYASLIERLFMNIDLIEEMLLEKFGVNYKVLFLNDEEWKIEKTKYIKNLKSGYKYIYREETLKIKKNAVENEKNDDDIDKIVDIIGDEMIKYI